jgi:hypothetical protein
MKDNKHYAKTLHESGAELLFIGFTVEKTQGTRCIVTNLNETDSEYAEEIRRINKNDVENESGCAFDTLNGTPMVIWKYSKSEFRFVEYFFSIDTYNIRVAFWTRPKLFDNFLPVYQGVMSTLAVSGR